MPTAKRFVYIIQSIGLPAAYYIGLTSDVEARLTAHNAGFSPHTARESPLEATGCRGVRRRTAGGPVWEVP